MILINTNLRKLSTWNKIILNGLKVLEVSQKCKKDKLILEYKKKGFIEWLYKCEDN